MSRANAVGAMSCPSPTPQKSRSISPYASLRPSFDVLNLLARSLELRFQRDDQVRNLCICGLGSDRVCFAMHFLEHEIQLATDRFLRDDQLRNLSRMTRQPTYPSLYTSPP